MKNIATEMPNAASIASAVAAGKISARELLDVSITCIASTDRRVNAFTDLTLARAQKEADAVDAQCARWRQHGNAADKPGAGAMTDSGPLRVVVLNGYFHDHATPCGAPTSRPARQRCADHAARGASGADAGRKGETLGVGEWLAGLEKCR